MNDYQLGELQLLHREAWDYARQRIDAGEGTALARETGLSRSLLGQLANGEKHNLTLKSLDKILTVARRG